MNLRKRIRDWLFSDLGRVAVCVVCGKSAHQPARYGGTTMELCVEHLNQWSEYAMALPNHQRYIISSTRAAAMGRGMLPFDEPQMKEWLNLEAEAGAEVARWLEA